MKDRRPAFWIGPNCDRVGPANKLCLRKPNIEEPLEISCFILSLTLSNKEYRAWVLHKSQIPTLDLKLQTQLRGGIHQPFRGWRSEYAELTTAASCRVGCIVLDAGRCCFPQSWWPARAVAASIPPLELLSPLQSQNAFLRDHLRDCRDWALVGMDS